MWVWAYFSLMFCHPTLHGTFFAVQSIVIASPDNKNFFR